MGNPSLRLSEVLSELFLLYKYEIKKTSICLYLPSHQQHGPQGHMEIRHGLMCQRVILFQPVPAGNRTRMRVNSALGQLGLGQVGLSHLALVLYSLLFSINDASAILDGICFIKNVKQKFEKIMFDPSLSLVCQS